MFTVAFKRWFRVYDFVELLPVVKIVFPRAGRRVLRRYVMSNHLGSVQFDDECNGWTLMVFRRSIAPETSPSAGSERIPAITR